MKQPYFLFPDASLNFKKNLQLEHLTIAILSLVLDDWFCAEALHRKLRCFHVEIDLASISPVSMDA
jgi:hypothetical protein